MSRFGLATLLLLLLVAAIVIVSSRTASTAESDLPDSTATRLGPARALAPGAAGDRADQLTREIERLGGVTAPDRQGPLR